METVHKKKSNNEKESHNREVTPAQTKGKKHLANPPPVKVSVNIHLAAVSGVQQVASWRRFWRKLITEATDGTG